MKCAAHAYDVRTLGFEKSCISLEWREVQDACCIEFVHTQWAYVLNFGTKEHCNNTLALPVSLYGSET